MKDFEGKQNMFRNYPIIFPSKMCSGKEYQWTFGLNLLFLKQSQYQQIRRWGVRCVSSKWQFRQKHQCWTQDWEAQSRVLSSLCPLTCLLVGESWAWHWCIDCSVEWESVFVSSVSVPHRFSHRRGQSLRRADRRTPLKSRWQNQGWRWSRHWGPLWQKRRSKAVCQIWDLNGDHKIWPQTTYGICTVWSTGSLEEQKCPDSPTPSQCPSSHAASSREA